jgi:hypothetical protein
MKRPLRKYLWFLLGVAASCLFIRWNGRRNRPERVGTIASNITPDIPQSDGFGTEESDNRITIKRTVNHGSRQEFETVATASLPPGFTVDPMGGSLLQGKNTPPSTIYFVLTRNPKTPNGRVLPPSSPVIYRRPVLTGPYQPLRRETRLCRITAGASQVEVIASSPYEVSGFAIADNIAYWIDPQPETVMRSYPHNGGMAVLPEPQGRLMATDLRTLKSRTFRTRVSSCATMQFMDDGVCIQDGAGAGVHTRTWFYKPTMSEPVAIGFDCTPPLVAAGNWIYWTQRSFDGAKSITGTDAPEEMTVDVVAQRLDGTDRKIALSNRSHAATMQEILAYQGHAYAVVSNVDNQAPGFYLFQIDPLHPADSRKLTDLPGYVHTDKFADGYFYYIAGEQHETSTGGNTEGYARYRYKLP